MRKKVANSLMAITMAGTMILSNGMAVLASSATGNGIVEYDNSEAIAYDIVNVPTLTASTYNFTLDPTGQLHTYLPGDYDEGTVYFQSAKSAAFIEGAKVDDATVTLYTQGKEVVAAVSGAWADIITSTTSGEDTVLDEVAAGFFVWVPDSDDATYTTGLPGKFVELTASNIQKWFVLDLEAETISLKDNYKAAPDVCDGKIYQLTYTALTGNKITDSAADPLTNYVTVTDGAVTAVSNLYKEGSTAGTYVAATASDVKYTAAVSGYQGVTDTVTVINKSTNAKTVTATVTMSNIEGISFNDASTFEDGDATANLYVAATNGTTTNALELADDGETATATYTVELAAPTITENTFMTEDTNEATGGHDYARYEGYGTTYGSDSFYITAAANSNDDAVEAWNEWLSSVTEDTRPTIDIVYTVENKVEGPSVTATSAGVITVRNLTAEQNYQSLTMTGNLSNGTRATFHVNKDRTAVSWDESGYNAQTGGTLVCTLTKAWGAYWDEQEEGQTITVTLTLTDGTTKTTTVVLDKE